MGRFVNVFKGVNMFQKNFYLFLLLFFFGCSTVSMSNYIKDDHPYKKKFDADYENVKKITMDALKKFGWTIEGESEPSIFEAVKEIENPDAKQIMLFTTIRHSGFFVGSSYSRVNVFLRGYKNEFTEVEIRYIKLTTVPLKRFTGYRQDALVKKIFNQIQKKLDDIDKANLSYGQVPSPK